MSDFSEDEVRSNAFFSHKEAAQMTGRLHFNRRVLIAGELNSKSLRKAVLELIKLELVNNEPITILLESGGGDVTPAQQFQDTLSMFHSPIDVIILGDCCSMAVDLVQMCRHRMMLPTSRMLIHYIRNRQPWIVDDMEKLDKDLQYFKEHLGEVRENRFVLYEKRTGLSRDRLEEIFRHGEVQKAYFTARQALALGLVDEIIQDFKLFPKKVEEEK